MIIKFFSLFIYSFRTIPMELLRNIQDRIVKQRNITFEDIENDNKQMEILSINRKN